MARYAFYTGVLDTMARRHPTIYSSLRSASPLYGGIAVFAWHRERPHSARYSSHHLRYMHILAVSATGFVVSPKKSLTPQHILLELLPLCITDRCPPSPHPSTASFLSHKFLSSPDGQKFAVSCCNEREVATPCCPLVSVELLCVSMMPLLLAGLFVPCRLQIRRLRDCWRFSFCARGGICSGSKLWGGSRHTPESQRAAERG